MKLKSFFSKLNIVTVIALLCTVAITGCSDDNEEMQVGNGYVQFKLYKSIEDGEESATRATTDKLDFLNDAKKMQVVLLHNNTTITQSVPLNAYNDQLAEYGLRSDKLELLPGDYKLIGYYLFNKVEEKIFSGEPAEPTTFTIQTGGLIVQDIYVKAVNSGLVKFKLVKDFYEGTSENTRAGGNGGGKTYLFSEIAKVDIKVRNRYTQQDSTFTNLKVKYKEGFDGTEAGSPGMAVGVIDTLVTVEAGEYEVISYTTYNKTSKIPLESTASLKENSFIIKEGEETHAEVPVKTNRLAADIQDYYALKAIWEALGGKNWSFNGEGYPRGTNWDFNKEEDMWGNQPGVAVNSEGRVTALNIGDFNPKGVVPKELGLLTELTVLTLGSHNDKIGSISPQMKYEAEAATTYLEETRNDYYNKFLKKSPYANFSATLQPDFKVEDLKKNKTKETNIMPTDVQPGDYTNGITGFEDGDNIFKNLTKLRQFYIANGEISSLPSSMKYLEECRDVEIYNCQKMTEFPEELNELKNLEALNLAMNPQFSSEELLDGLKSLATSDAGKSIQILYLGYNNLTEIPKEFAEMKKLSKLDCVHNKIKTLYPMGADIDLTQLTMDYNEIEEIPDNFSGINNIETYSFSHNKLKVLPDMFDASSIYVMSSVNFSYNEIASIENDGNGYKGINASTIDLSYNKLTKFPGAIIQAGSPVSSLTLAGNQISEFPKGASKGPRANMLNTLDLTFNCLTELPEDFSTNFYYIVQMDLSYNRFNKFPFEALYIQTLRSIAVRHQRDADGYRCMKEWPTNVATCPVLQRLFLGGNDIGEVPETEEISYRIYILDISDNPEIVINVSAVCPYITAGMYTLIYDSWQNIRGCPALKLENK